MAVLRSGRSLALAAAMLVLQTTSAFLLSHLHQRQHQLQQQQRHHHLHQQRRVVTRAWPWEQQEDEQPKEPVSEDNGTGGKKPGIDLQGLVDLMALGAGAPNLGKFTGVDKETGTLNFELEKNNFQSKKTGKTYNSFDNRDATYFNEGYVDEEADVMAKFSKMFGGGKKKEEE